MEKISLHARQKKILSILNAKHGVATGKELSAKIGVSERTIRSDISAMNDSLKSYGIQIIPLHGRGYTLTIKDRAVFLELFSEKENYITKEDRLRTMLLRLLREDDWYDLGNLEDEMFVSHTTIEKDVKAMKRRISLQHPFLQLERKGNMIRIENDERKKRDLFTRFYAENWDYDSKEGIVLKKLEVGDETLNDIQKVLKSRVLASRIYLDDYAFIYLALAISIMYLRLLEGHKVQKSDRENPVIDEDIRYVLDQLKRSWNIEIDEPEYHYLSEIKEQLVFLSERTYSKNYVLGKTDISCHHIVDDLLDELLQEYGIDFTEDDKLFVDLDRHVQALKNGIIAPSVQNHVLGDELRRRNPFLGDIAHTMRMKLSKKCEMDLGIEEEDYLLPFIILAEESLYKKKRGKGIPTAVISHYNESMTHYLMVLLQRHYGAVLDLHGPYAIHAKELIAQEDTMLVLTTVQMQDFDKIFKIPVLTVSPLIETTDQIGIDLYLTSLKSTYLYQTPDLPMKEYYPDNLVYRMKDKSNLITAINETQTRLMEEAGITNLPKFNMESDYYCTLSNGFMFCYQTCDDLELPIASLVDLGKDISCKYVRNIKTLMYMVMPSKEKTTLGWYYYLAMALSQHSEELKAVFEGKSLEDLTININRNIK